MHHGGLFRLRRRYPHPAPDKRACRSSGGVFEVDSTSKARRATSLKLRKYDARCCIIFTERYRSGDVAERCQWQKKRGIRSGSGRNFVSESEQKISGTATGHNEAEPRKFNIECWAFLSLNIYTEGYRSGHNEAVLKICSREFLQSAKNPCYAWCFHPSDEAENYSF